MDWTLHCLVLPRPRLRQVVLDLSHLLLVALDLLHQLSGVGALGLLRRLLAGLDLHHWRLRALVNLRP